MKYILMMSLTKANTGCEPMDKWDKKDAQAHIAFLIGLNKKLRASGEFVTAEGLAGPEEAKIVRARRNGVPITDGVFPEAKEFLVGYWIIDVESPERAYAIAANASAAPGPGGVSLNMPIEVRRMIGGPPEDLP